MAANLKILFKESWLTWVLAGIGLSPLLWIFCLSLWEHPAYQFFPLALIGAGLLAARAAREFVTVPVPGQPRVTRYLLGVLVVAFLVGNVLWSPWFGLLTLILLLVAVIWQWGGRPALLAFVPALLVVASIIPPPLGWDLDLTLWLRSVAVMASGHLLDAFNVIHTLEGNTILLPGKSLLVAEACSGINSVVLCSALGLFYILWQRRPLTWLLILLPATCAFVVLGNIIRITLGAVLYFRWQMDWLGGWRHEVIGLLLLLGYGMLILSMDQLLFFLHPITPHKRNAKNVTRPQSSEGNPSPAFSKAIKATGWFLAVIGLTVFAGRLFLGGPQMIGWTLERSAPRNLQLSLPAEVAGWHQLDDRPRSTLAETRGVRSLLWRFARDGVEATVAVDYPLMGFHNVKICYQANGWQIVSEDKILFNQDGDDMPAFKLRMQRSVCQQAVVFHSVINERGQWLLPPVVKSALRDRLSGPDPTAFDTSYRIQVLTGAYTPLADSTLIATRELFFQSSQLLRRQMATQFTSSNPP